MANNQPKVRGHKTQYTIKVINIMYQNIHISTMCSANLNASYGQIDIGVSSNNQTRQTSGFRGLDKIRLYRHLHFVSKTASLHEMPVQCYKGPGKRQIIFSMIPGLLCRRQCLLPFSQNDEKKLLEPLIFPSLVIMLSMRIRWYIPLKLYCTKGWPYIYTSIR